MEDNKLWIARDKNGATYLFVSKPYRDKLFDIWNGSEFCKINKNLFQDLTWDDGPLEVEWRPVINDIEAKAKEYADSVTDKEELKDTITIAYKAGYNIESNGNR